MPDSSLTAFDKRLAEDVTLEIVSNQGGGGSGSKIEFQFAPHIVADSNSMNWTEDAIFGPQPLSFTTGASSRRISLEYEYIATDNKFSPEFIAEQLHSVKKYFYEFRPNLMPIIWLQYTGVIPIRTPFRLLDINIQHGKEMVSAGRRGPPQFLFYPLYTKVTLTMRLIYKLFPPAKGGGAGKKAKQKIEPLPKFNERFIGG
jgi:hypothetical protein